MAGILIIAEHVAGALRDITREAVGAASQIKADFGGPVVVAVLSGAPDALVAELSLEGVDEIAVVRTPGDHFDPLVYEEADDGMFMGVERTSDDAFIVISIQNQETSEARYISGHLHRTDGIENQEAAHAWAEAWVEDLGWVGFDAANGISPTEHYVRVACGLDALGASPIRGISYGGGRETMTVALRVRQMQQTQQQQQRQGWS
ncbi:MAG: hypothetical protein B7Z42_09760 [Brevundimonas sp. 12-68-7]|nr:MAG: hypothetical protein B7Z42_09760 [Brevundimonas sp. 12-68-7]